MTSNAPVLCANALTKRIGKRTIVDQISFELQQGEIFGFLGPNGAGKTTTIRMLVGLITPTHGTAQICGYDIQQEFEKATRCIGAIVESPDLYRFMTGRENLEHFSRMLGIRDAGEVERVAALVNLQFRLDDKVRTYSLGMRQRLGIAQALLGTPKLLILDEPANGLDPAGIREIRELLRSLARETGISVFISSHLLAEIELMCDRVAIIHRGKILTVGRVEELVSASRELELRVSDLTVAARVLDALELPYRIEDDALLVGADESSSPELLRRLIDQNVDVYRLERRVQTLEQTFLAATGGESVGA